MCGSIDTEIVRIRYVNAHKQTDLRIHTHARRQPQRSDRRASTAAGGGQSFGGRSGFFLPSTPPFAWEQRQR